ncbi:interleukin-1 receptor-like 1 [Polymixia lowei]
MQEKDVQREKTDDRQTKITASLVFRKVSEANLSNEYICKLESTSLSSNVTISLVRRNGKSYDAYIMCYKSDTETGLDEKQRRWLEKVLEEELGYNLCLYDRDVSPGEAVAEAVLGCVEQSRTVVLIPISQDPGEGFGLLSAIHTALVERQTRLVLINTELNVTPHPSLHDSTFPEVLRLLAKAGHSVTWRGPSSQPLSSSFWKLLRYHLPAPQHLRSVITPTDIYSIC